MSRHCKAIARCVRHQISHNVELQHPSQPQEENLGLMRVKVKAEKDC